MGQKITKEYKRLTPSESVALLKDKETKKLTWRHRYSTRTSISKTTQTFQDYPHGKFSSIEEFYGFADGLLIKHKTKG
jgi:hypothetical protein